MSKTNISTGAALMHAGVMVFPCQEGGLSAKAPYTRRGFKDATTDMLSSDRWSLMFPGAVWGLPCALNGVLVLDADRHGKGDGVDNIMALFAHHRFDCRTVPVVATPNRGYHFYFRRPEWLGRTKAKLCNAVDVRDNAYVIAPDSNLGDGRGYSLVAGTLPQFAKSIADRSLIDPPPWLSSMLLPAPTPAPPAREAAERSEDAAVLNQIKAIIGAALRAEEGNRNLLLFWAACRLAEMVNAELLVQEWATAVLEETGARLGLSTNEVRGTVASGLRNGR